MSIDELYYWDLKDKFKKKNQPIIYDFNYNLNFSIYSLRLIKYFPNDK